jgi:hypothetical protein
LSIEQVDILWDSLIAKALCVEERERMFVWLEKVNENEGFSENVIDHLFTEKMSTIDCTTLSKAGYAVFDRYFLSINERLGRVKRSEKKSGIL